MMDEKLNAAGQLAELEAAVAGLKADVTSVDELNYDQRYTITGHIEALTEKVSEARQLLATFRRHQSERATAA